MNKKDETKSNETKVVDEVAEKVTKPEEKLDQAEELLKTFKNTFDISVSAETTHEEWQRYLDNIVPGKFVLVVIRNTQGGGTRLLGGVKE